MEHSYELKAKPKTDIIEDQSLQVFSGLVDFNRMDIHHSGGKVISYDGEIKLLDDQGRLEVVKLNGKDTTVDTKYQIKGTTQEDKTSYSFDVADLTAYHLYGKPIFIFLVDVKEGVVYYEIINDKYIQYVLKIDLQNLAGQQTKTISFHKKFNRDTTPLLADFINCQNIGNPSAPQFPATGENPSNEEISNHTTLIGSLNAQTLCNIEALIFLSPLDQSDKKYKSSICKKLEIEEKDLDFYLKHMVEKGVIINTGGAFLVKDVKMAKYFLAELITRKGIEFIYG